MPHPTVGVLALQGAFAKHIEMLRSIGVHAIEVRYPKDLLECDALIIPGGESTVISRQLKFIALEDTLCDFAQKKPIFGTCAGLILMSKEVIGDSLKPFNIIDVGVERNAYGRQVESFNAEVELALGREKHHPFHAIFIRAPRIKECSGSVKILATHNGEPILVQQGHHLGATFHPELGNDPAIHLYFLNLIKPRNGSSR